MATQHATPATHSSNCACTGRKPNGRLRSSAKGTKGADAVAGEAAAPSAAPPAEGDDDAGTTAAASISTIGARWRMG